MNKIIQTLVIVSVISLVGFGSYHIYEHFSDKQISTEFDDQNSSIKTTLISSYNISFSDNLTMQSENSLSVTKKLNYYTTSNKKIEQNVSFIDGENADECITVYIDDKNMTVTFFILKDFDKQIQINLFNDDLNASFVLDYYKTITRVNYHDGGLIFLKENAIKETFSDELMRYDTILNKQFSLYTIDTNDYVSFEGEIQIVNTDEKYTNEFINSIIQNELNTYMINQLKNFENIPNAEDIWKLSDSIIWKEYLKKFDENSRHTLEIYLNGKLNCRGREILDTSKKQHEFYFIAELFNYNYSQFE